MSSRYTGKCFRFDILHLFFERVIKRSSCKIVSLLCGWSQFCVAAFHLKRETATERQTRQTVDTLKLQYVTFMKLYVFLHICYNCHYVMVWEIICEKHIKFLNLLPVLHLPPAEIHNSWSKNEQLEAGGRS